jgi:hypothetical protein
MELKKRHSAHASNQTPAQGDKIELVERRRSNRWLSAKAIDWRIFGGRRVRHGVVPQRSMEGMVICTGREDIAPPGTHVSPGTDESGLKHGFRDGIIRRISQIDIETHLLFVEILA